MTWKRKLSRRVLGRQDERVRRAFLNFLGPDSQRLLLIGQIFGLVINFDDSGAAVDLDMSVQIFRRSRQVYIAIIICLQRL